MSRRRWSYKLAAFTSFKSQAPNFKLELGIFVFSQASIGVLSIAKMLLNQYRAAVEIWFY
ncbi:hypothetical protein NMS_1094 [Nonlabens marinus S1-08]|uniref:Uncharacterized protein n=1 Tax=Nonlabens marinus S1-08 TaxID=1454201 RepID=W8VV37_9FLAO|nr:hypothetical protein NMS_1094 [Nonlabens marinus S1-08]